nr:MAG TPA: hypothetical protein [Caudoviricetes sp.]
MQFYKKVKKIFCHFPLKNDKLKFKSLEKRR